MIPEGNFLRKSMFPTLFGKKIRRDLLSERDQLDACAFYHQYYSNTGIDEEVIKAVYKSGEEHLGFSLEGIHPDDRWVEDIYGDQGWDYLDLFEMVNDLEDEFDIEIAEDDLENIRTVDDLVRYIGTRVL